MSPLDHDILRRKLETIVADLRLLEPIAELELDAYLAEPYRRKATERMLQEIVEAAVDINAHVLVQAGKGAPDDLFASFHGMAAAGVLAPELAASLAPSAGLRNRLVHEYDRIDDAIVLAAVGEALALYPQYVAAIEAYLSSDGAA
ncbi:MAG: DUF86 domain-containing protein [Deltaproteobacteria bacterium]|jgi:uncharacterized protein YutE (UPF0331/DUF86 family)|nr:DUF86 domain-containing protein [Deltaproteobacteria bacterium]MBW2533356.1 DUF86 domain-containing protein [Deltaproteobacteria bacterium]